MHTHSLTSGTDIRVVLVTLDQLTAAGLMVAARTPSAARQVSRKQQLSAVSIVVLRSMARSLKALKPRGVAMSSVLWSN